MDGQTDKVSYRAIVHLSKIQILSKRNRYNRNKKLQDGHFELWSGFATNKKNIRTG